MVDGQQQLISESLKSIAQLRSALIDDSEEQELVKILILKGLDEIELNLRSINSSSLESKLQPVENVKAKVELVQWLLDGILELVELFLNQ